MSEPSYFDESRSLVADRADVRRAGLEPTGPPFRGQAVLVGVFNAWIVKPLSAEWTAAYRLALQDGAFVVSELRVFPSGRGFSPGEWSGIWTGLNATAPAGGLTATLAREASKINPAMTSGREVLEGLGARAKKLRRASSLLSDLQRRGLSDLRARDRASRGSGRPGKPDSFYRDVARIYLTAVSDRQRPNKAVAKALELSASQARDSVYRARRLGLLPKTERGRARTW